MEPLEAFYKSISKYFNLLMTVTAVSFILLVYPKGIDYDKPLEELYELKKLEEWYHSNAEIDSTILKELGLDVMAKMPASVAVNETRVVSNISKSRIRHSSLFTFDFIEGIELIADGYDTEFIFTFHINFGASFLERNVLEWISYIKKNEPPFIPLPNWQSINVIDSDSKKYDFDYIIVRTFKINNYYTFEVEGFSFLYGLPGMMISPGEMVSPRKTINSRNWMQPDSPESRGSVIATVKDFEPYYLWDLQPSNWVNQFVNDTISDFVSSYSLSDFPGLRSILSLVGDQNIDNAITTLQQKRDEAKKISFVGISVSFYQLFIFIPILLLYINAFLFTHLRQLNETLQNQGSDFTYPWIGKYDSTFSRVLSVLLIVMLPTLVSMANYIKYSNFITGWLDATYFILTILLFIVGVKIEEENINLRENANPNSPPP